ncbi:hypothetical protein ES703_115737 [subsurface metagenome]
MGLTVLLNPLSLIALNNRLNLLGRGKPNLNKALTTPAIELDMWLEDSSFLVAYLNLIATG